MVVLVDNDFDTILFDNHSTYIVKESELYDSKIDINDFYPDHFNISHRDWLIDIYNDIILKSAYSSLFDILSFSCFSDYAEYVLQNPPSDSHDWASPFDISLFEIKQFGRRNPSFKQWVRHFLSDLMSLYHFIVVDKQFDCGSFEYFMEFCYMNSSSSTRIPHF